jgi:hypothetical protein
MLPADGGVEERVDAVLGGWVVGGLLVSFRFFAWDLHLPGHARPAEAGTTLRSAKKKREKGARAGSL